MDYTVRTWNNLLPGEFNLNLLETLYGAPDKPLTSDPLIEGSTTAPTMTPRRPPPPPPRPFWPTNRDEKDKEKDEKEKDKEKDKEDRQLQQSETLEINSHIERALATCSNPTCVHVIDEEFTVIINKVLA